MKNQTKSVWIAALLAAAVAGCSVPGEPSVQTTASETTQSTTGKGSNSAASLTSLKLEEKELTLAPSQDYPLKITALNAKGEVVDFSSLAGKLQYKSSDPNVAAISSDGTLTASAKAVTGQTADIEISASGSVSATVHITIIEPLDQTVSANDNGKAVVTNATAVTVVVNKQRSLPDNYVPSNLVQPDVPFSFSGKSEKKLLRQEAADALEALFEKAKEDKIELYAVSGYRSYQTQKVIYQANVAAQGKQEASRYSAVPGESEHQTGLAMDVSSRSAKFALEEVFGTTPEGKWLSEHAHEFGFIIRYPKGKESITGYAYEPWHIRYVGKTIAAAIKEKNITLEEYFNDSVPVSKP
ncbi:M15 family metallopeptidase [Paenibacillus turpanensis]|uniref:M15 family metallopeptidase n=1 Tax=Paenibacillus turpanensis TaxID=2689078 RepID=UPI00140D27FD|nr:M15 family metallopeptidase [Paenibacillus turpanensis]